MLITISLFATFLIALIGTRLIIQTLRQSTLFVARPDFKNPEATPVPHGGGGIAWVFAFIIGALLADVMNYFLLLALFLLAAIALLDDLIRLPGWTKIIVYIAAIWLGLISMPYAHITTLSLGQERLALLILWLFYLLLFADMDQLDGFLPGQMIFTGLGAALVNILLGDYPDMISVGGLLLAVSALGFAWWNWFPAKIKLGAVGRVPAGFLLGFLLWQLAAAGHGVAALILPAYLISEAVARFGPLYQAERAVRAGIRENLVVTQTLGLAMLLVFLAIQSVLEPSIQYICLFGAYLASGLLIAFYHFAARQDAPA